MRRLFLAAFAAALVFTLVMAWLPHPPPVPFKEDDKFWHVAAFVALSFLASGAFPAAPLARIGERLSFLGALIEVVQSIPALHRDCDIRDWIADTIAVAVTVAIVTSFRRWRGTRVAAGRLRMIPGVTPPNPPHQGEG
jgi:hypothetical protein